MPYLMRYAVWSFPLFFGILLAQTTPPAKPPAPTFANTVRPFVEVHCQSCHNGKNRMGEVNFEVLKYATGVAGQPGIWETTALVLKSGRMPPPGVPRPPETEVTAARTMIETGLAELGERNKTAEPPPTREWLTWQADPERTGWARGETTLTKANAAKLELKWKAQLDAVPSRVNGYSTLTDPLVAEGHPHFARCQDVGVYGKRREQRLRHRCRHRRGDLAAAVSQHGQGTHAHQ